MIPGLASPRHATRRRTSEFVTSTLSQSSPDLHYDTIGTNATASSAAFITSSSTRQRMIPRNELELSRPSIVRAEKDGDDPNSSTSRRRPIPERTLTGTPTRLTRLFGSRSDRLSPGPSRSLSRAKINSRNPTFTRVVRQEGEPLPSHLYQRGLLEGKYSDIDVVVFGTSYPLHRIVLDQAPFFASALSPPWLEATAREVTLHPEEIDSNITKSAFELALRRLYGHPDYAAEATQAFSLFATACWLEMTELMTASVEQLLKQMAGTTLPAMINMVAVNYYGRAGDRVLHAAKAMLSRDGYEMSLKNWDDISTDVIRDIVGGDSFYVQTEWQRWNLARRLLNRRLKLIARDLGMKQDINLETYQAPFKRREDFEESEVQRGKTPIRPTSANDLGVWKTIYNQAELQPLFDLLQNSIHYLHFDFEQLQQVKTARDIFGVQLISDHITNDALWRGLELRQRILNAQDAEEELGFTQVVQQLSQSPSIRSSIPLAASSTVAGSTLEVPLEDTGHSRPQSPTNPSDQLLGTTNEGFKRYWIPSVDCNIVTGGAEPVVTLSTTISDHGRGNMKDNNRPVSANAEPRSTSYTTYPPFRFSAEFSNPRQFKPNKRVYSQTVFYAGSAWNIYLQRNKNTGSRSSQLGVYLHRAKQTPVSDNPWNASLPSVDDRIGDLERQLQRLEARRTNARRTRETLRDSSITHAQDTMPPIQDPRLPSPMMDDTGLSSLLTSTNITGASPTQEHPLPLTTPGGTSGDKDSTNDVDYSASDDDSTFDTVLPTSLAQGRPALTTYIDTRPVVKAYFKIYSPSRDGRMLSVYESQPDEFSFSQSWGWRSSSFFAEENDWMVDEVDIAEDTTWLPGLEEGRVGDEEAKGRFGGGQADDDDATLGANSSKQNGGGLVGGKLRFMVTLGLI